MAKTITITYEGTEYTLEFTRKSVETMERQGFVIGEAADKPMTSLPTLLAGAFMAHHKFVKPNVIDAIFKKIPNKQEFLTALIEMYSEPLEVLMEEPEDTEGNLTWGTNW